MDALMRSIEVTIPGIGVIEASAANPVPVHFRALMKQDERQAFWINRQWPEDAFGRVFLARAAIRIGEAMFGADWTGHEPGVNTTLQPLPMFPSQARNWEVKEAMDALPMADRVPIMERLSSIPMPGSTVDQRDWDKAAELRAKALAAIAAPRARWEAAQYRLREAMKTDPGQAGAVKFYALNALTGDYSPPLPHKWWNTTEHWRARFYWCQINQAEPITASVGGSKFQRIFVDGTELDRLIASIEAAAGPATSLRHKREFMELLKAAVAASDENPFTRRHWQDRARNEYRLSRDEFDKVWDDVMALFPAAKWSAPGRPRKNRE
jgi:hypothetical protein